MTDPLLWKAALSVVSDEFLQRYERESKNKAWGVVVGPCSHWLLASPDQVDESGWRSHTPRVITATNLSSIGP